MKKSTKVWLIVAGSLLVCGLVIFCCAIATVDFKLDRLNFDSGDFIRIPFFHGSVSYSGFSDLAAERVDYELTGTDYESIYIDENISSIVIAPSDSGKYSVTYYELDDYKHTVSDDGKSFSLTGRGDLSSENAFNWVFGWVRDDTRSRTNRFRVTLNVPADYSGSLDIVTSCGEVEINDISSQNVINIENKLGSSSLKNVNCSDVDIFASAGDVDIDKLNASSLKIVDHLGTVTLNNSSCESKTFISANAGSIDLDWFSASSLEIVDNLGSVGLSRVTIAEKCVLDADMGDISGKKVASGALTADCKTGGINFEQLLCGDVELDVSSGSIDCEIDGNPNDYRIYADSNLGDVNLSDRGSDQGTKSIRANAKMGDVNITFDR